MASVHVADKFLITFVGDCLNQRIINTFWYGVSTIIGTPDSNAFADEIRAALIASGGLRQKFLAVTPQNYTLQFMWIQRVDSPRLLKKIYPDNSPGTWAVDTDAANIAGTITRRGDLAIKKAIGSLHVMVSTDPTSILAGELGITLNGLFNTLANEMLDSLNLATLGQLFPIIRNGSDVAAYQAVTSVTVHPEVRTMRRRTLRLGE